MTHGINQTAQQIKLKYGWLICSLVLCENSLASFELLVSFMLFCHLFF